MASTHEEGEMTETTAKPTRLPPRWFVRVFWVAHRGFYLLSQRLR